MEAVVRSFPPGSAVGPFGLRPQHLLDCRNSADSAKKAGYLEALLTLVTDNSTCHLHPRAAPYHFSARLIPLRKKDGGVRSIPVGDTLQRLMATRLLPSAQGQSAAAALALLQTAFGKGIHCEVVAMGVQEQVDALHARMGWLLLEVDLNHLFNCIAPPAILKALERLCPSTLPWGRQFSSPRPCWSGRR